MTIDMTITPDEAWGNTPVVQVPLEDASFFGAKLATGLWDEQGRPTGVNASLAAEAQAPASQAPQGTPPNYTPWLNLAGQAVGTTGDVIIAAIRGQNERERQRLEAETAARIRELQFPSMMDAQERARRMVALQSLFQLLVMRRQAEQPPKDNTVWWVVGSILLLGGVFLYSQRR